MLLLLRDGERVPYHRVPTVSSLYSSRKSVGLASDFLPTTQITYKLRVFRFWLIVDVHVVI